MEVGDVAQPVDGLAEEQVPHGFGPKSYVSVLKFDDPGRVDQVLLAMHGTQQRGLITLEDAAVVSWPEGDMKPEPRQLPSTTGVGALSGTFWGMLLGLNLFVLSGAGTANARPLACSASRVEKPMH
jgi:uncharacterized membrane protein